MTRFGEDILADTGGLVVPNTELLMPLPGKYSDSDITGLTINQYFPLHEGHLGLATLGKLDIIDAVTLFFPSVAYGQEGFLNVKRPGQRAAVVWRRAGPLPVWRLAGEHQ